MLRKEVQTRPDSRASLANDEGIINQDGLRSSWHACARGASNLTEGTALSPVH